MFKYKYYIQHPTCQIGISIIEYYILRILKSKKIFKVKKYTDKDKALYYKYLKDRQFKWLMLKEDLIMHITEFYYKIISLIKVKK